MGEGLTQDYPSPIGRGRREAPGEGRSYYLLPRFFLFLRNGFRRLILSTLDPSRECVRIHKRMRLAWLSGLQHHASLQHTATGVTVVAGPAMDLQVHLHTFY